MAIVHVDGAPASIRALTSALEDALNDGPAVLPVGAQTQEAVTERTQAAADDHAAALVVTTSGSTGRPKRVLLSAAALRASAQATHRRLDGPGKWLLASPAHYIGGLQVVIRSLIAGGRPHVMDLSNGFRPDAFADAARRSQTGAGPHYTALVPTQLTRILDAGGEAAESAAGFDAILIGGAATPPDLRKRAAAAGIKIVRAYGMSETASGCVYDGVPLDCTTIRTTNGRIEIGGATLAMGYLQDDGTVEKLPGEDGWFTTDDIGTISSGVLTVRGRADAVINTGGVKVPAHAVEEALTSQNGISAACVVALPDSEWGQIVAAVVVAEPEAPSTTDLTAAVADKLGKPAAPKIIRTASALPLRGPGKVDRRAVAELLAGHADAPTPTQHAGR